MKSPSSTPPAPARSLPEPVVDPTEQLFATSPPRPHIQQLHRVIADTKEFDSELLEDKSTVLGVLCADKNGLCIGVDGRIDRNLAGLSSSLTEAAAKVEPGNPELPVIVLDRVDGTQLLVKRSGDVTVAILKNQSTLPERH